MGNFKQYMKDNADIEKSLAKLPKAHRKLLYGFHIKLEPGNTLPGDDGHVGVIMTSPRKQIKVASPWNYPREFALLHEIGHLVWAVIMTPKLKKEWSGVCKLHSGRKKNESDEENFCHAYSARYVKNPPVVHHHEAWRKFIEDLP